jgi:hypothetical protein
MPKSQKTLNRQCKSASQSSFLSLQARLVKNAKIKRGRLLMDRIYYHLFKFWGLRGTIRFSKCILQSIGKVFVQTERL